LSDARLRARRAFLGLALGDAYGRELEFVRGSRVRTTPIALDPVSFKWTDDTHMALYLAEAILTTPEGALDEDLLGHAVGAAFVRWAHDPLTPSTVPGLTSLRGAEAYERWQDWRRSGDPRSDGCGAPMRVVPVALAYSGDDLVRAAEVSAVVTHGHANAVEAAIAAAWLARATLVEGSLSVELVQAAIAGLRGRWSRGGVVAEALEAAIEQALRPDLEWLDEDAIPTGDGGWRAASAVGLAVTAALRGGSFDKVVDLAARIDGDSDSVAAIAGMLSGWRLERPGRLKPEMVRDGDRIVALADALWARSGG
jgi:ADP-ribosylglycohydrolase